MIVSQPLQIFLLSKSILANERKRKGRGRKRRNINYAFYPLVDSQEKEDSGGKKRTLWDFSRNGRKLVCSRRSD